MLAAAALAQLSSAMVVAVAATDVTVLAVLSVEVAVLARDDHFSLSAGLIVALCVTQWQCLCLRHISSCLGWLEKVSPQLHMGDDGHGYHHH